MFGNNFVRRLDEIKGSELKDVIKILKDINWDTDDDFYIDYINSETSECYILEDDDSVFGYICVEYYEDRIHINDIVVGESYRGKGYGKDLVDYVVENAPKNVDGKITMFTLEVSNKNLKALTFYLKYGFIVVGFIANYYGTEDHAIYMEYRLKERGID